MVAPQSIPHSHVTRQEGGYMSRWLSFVVSCCAAIGIACGGDEGGGTPDARPMGTADANRTPDSGTPDARPPDANTTPDARPDAGTPDSGTPDAQQFDAGTPDANLCPG